MVAGSKWDADMGHEIPVYDKLYGEKRYLRRLDELIRGSESVVKSLRAEEEGISQPKKKAPKLKQDIKSERSSTKRPKPEKSCQTLPELGEQ